MNQLRRMRRALVLIPALSMLLLLFCSCVSQNAASEQAGLPPQAESTPAPLQPRATAQEVQTRLLDPVLNWYPGTAGSSLKLAAAAAEVLSFAAEFDGTADLASWWDGLPDEEKQRFEANVDEIAALLESTRADYASLSGLYEDAGVGERMEALLARDGIWENWERLHLRLKNPQAEPGT